MGKAARYSPTKRAGTGTSKEPYGAMLSHPHEKLGRHTYFTQTHTIPYSIRASQHNPKSTWVGGPTLTASHSVALLRYRNDRRQLNRPCSDNPRHRPQSLCDGHRADISFPSVPRNKSTSHTISLMFTSSPGVARKWITTIAWPFSAAHIRAVQPYCR